jgi:GT2 family glycosyltransferase
MTRGVRIVRSETPLGYPKACNTGAAAARGKVLLFMNNDIEVNADSIRLGISRLAGDPAIGAVGGRIILMNGQLQEAGSYMHEDGSTHGYGRFENPSRPRYNVAQTVDYCSGCFLFIRRGDFEAVDGFDEVFSPGYYEEADLCLRLRARGLATLFDPGIYIYHYEYASYSKGRPPAVSVALMRRNSKEFLLRHHHTLAHAPRVDTPDWYRQLAASRYEKSLSIAVVEDMIPDRSIGSGFVRAADLVDTLLKSGHRVTLFALHYRAGLHPERLRQRGVEVVTCYGPDADPYPLEGREWDFDAVWICRTHNIFEWSKHVRRAKVVNPGLRVVFDTEAISSLRTMAYWRLHNMAPSEDLQSLLSKEFELDNAILPDVVVAVNETDRKAVETLSIAPVFTLGHKMEPDPAPPGPEGRSGLFFCGSFHEIDSPNYDSIEWFLDQVWPHVLARLPEVRLTISGYCAPDVPLNALLEAAPGVDYVGRADSVIPLMKQARCFIAPTRFAGGIPHKVHEAMAAGLPVVCTDILRNQLGVPAIPPDQVPVLSAEPHAPAAFAEACCALLQDDAMWADQQKAALGFIETAASSTVFRAELEKIIDAL